MAHRQTTRVVAGVLFVLTGTAFLLESFQVWEVHSVDLWPLLLIAVGTAVVLGRFHRIRTEEDRSAQLAVAEERVRIARELHDIVAHGVSLMTIQIAAARRVQQAQPEAAEESLKAAEETGRQSLAQLQGMLNMLRGADASIGAADPIPRRETFEATEDRAARWAADAARRAARMEEKAARHAAHWEEKAAHWAAHWERRAARWALPGTVRIPSPPRPAQPPAPPKREPPKTNRAPLPRLADMGQLVDSMRQAGLNVDSTIVGTSPPLSPSVELVIYRVIQEALTNAMRYAPKAHVQLEVTYAPQHVLVFVDDDGAAAQAGKTTSPGHGLVGMYERVAAVGGTLEAGPRQPGPGWRVHAKIPITP
ncbi:MAG TPA: histidine kinase [Acidimicrobiales bacterium]